MRQFILIFLLISFPVSSVHAFDQEFSTAKNEISAKLSEAKQLSQQKKYGEAIELLENLNRELESRPKLKGIFASQAKYLIDSIRKKIAYNDSIKAKNNANTKLREAGQLSQQKKYGEAIELLENLSRELESKPNLKGIFASDVRKGINGNNLQRARKACSFEGFASRVDMGRECVEKIKKIRVNYFRNNQFICNLLKTNQKQEMLPLDEILDDAKPGTIYQLNGKWVNNKNLAAYIKREISLRRESLQKFDQLIKEFGLDTNPLPCAVQLRVSYVKIIEKNVEAYKRQEVVEKRKEEANKLRVENIKKIKKQKEEQDAKTVDLHYKSGLFRKFTDDQLKKEEEGGRSSRTGADYQLWLKGNKHFASGDNEAKLVILGAMKQTTTVMQVVQFCEKNNIINKDFYLDMAEVKRIMNVFQMLIPVQIDKGILFSQIESHPVPKEGGVPLFRKMYELVGSRHPKAQKLCRDQQKMMRVMKMGVATMFNMKK